MSLRRIPAARVEHTGFWVFAQHHFTVTPTRSYTRSNRDYHRARTERAAVGAALIAVDGQRNLWWTEDGLYWADAGHDAEEVSLLVWDRSRRQDARLERLRSARARAEAVESARRTRIPDDVRAFVWERDDGRCVACEADEDLQFDHVIPVALGGGNGTDNLQVLCGACNRSKADRIA
jgi:5-methylcytosine-specific restriction endonuclease McrA